VQGLAWIEVKAHEPFDINSSQWLGNPGHFKGACFRSGIIAFFGVSWWPYQLQGLTPV